MAIKVPKMKILSQMQSENILSDKTKSFQYISINAASFFKFATIILAIFLIALQLYHVFYGPIWRDDAYFGIVAKNIANGDGYKAVYFDKSYLLHYGISLGPLMILPTALAIYFFGNQSWVLGLVNILFIWGLLIAIFIYAKHFIGKERRWQFSFLALSFAIIFSNSAEIYPYGIDFKSNLALWHLLLGEIPAALCVILGAMILFSAKNSCKRTVAGGMVLGSAALIKTISLIIIAPILAVASWIIFFNKYTNKNKILLIFLLGFTVIAPSLIFEASKRVSLGQESYQELKHQNKGYYKANSLVYKPTYNNGIIVYPNRLNKVMNFKEHIGHIGIFIFLIGQFYIIYLCYKNRLADKDRYVRAAGIALMLGFYVNMLWWVFLSTGNVRYLLPGVLCYLFGISLLITVIAYKNTRQLICVLLMISLLIISKADAMGYLFYNGFKSNNRLEGQLTVVKNIDMLQKKGVTMFSCGNNFELEYLLQKSNNFKNCSEMFNNKDAGKSMLVTYFSYPGYVVQTGANDYYTKTMNLPAITSNCRKNFLRGRHVSLDWCDAPTQN